MNAVQLFAKEVQHGAVWMCQKCGRLFTRQYEPIGAQGGRRYTPEERDEFARRSAERCCDHRCKMCGEPAFAEWQVLCRRHLDEQRAEDARRTEAARFERAQKLTTADVLPDCMLYSEHNDRWFVDLEEAEDYYADTDDVERPDYLWLSRANTDVPDVRDFVSQHVHDEHGEDAADRIGGDDWRELEEWFGDWWGSLGVVSYTPDYSRCLLLDPAPDCTAEGA